MTTRSLVSLICDPLWRHKHTSREFPAPFLSFCLIQFLSSSPLLCHFPPLCPLAPFFCLPLFLTLSPLLFTLGSHFSFCCLCLCFTIDLLLRHCLSFCFLLYSLISLQTEGITVLLLDVRQDVLRTLIHYFLTSYSSWDKKTGIITHHCPAD